MTDALHQRLLGIAGDHTPGSREPVPLNDPAVLWWVESGTVDVFAMPAVDGLPAGAREHVYRVGSGQIFFGADLAALGRSWLLVGVATSGTHLRSLSWSALAELANVPDLRDDVAALVTRWATALTRGTAQGLQPKQYLPLRHDAEHEVAAGQAFFPISGLVFVRVLEGQARFLSNDQAVVSVQTPLLPLPAEAWMLAAATSRVQSLGAVAALAQDDIWQGLQAYQLLIVQLALDRFEATAAHETVRMKVKARRAADHMQAGLDVVTRTLRGEQAMAFAELSPDPLLAACQLIGRRIGVDFAPPPRGGVDRADPVEEIANAARVRFRQVALRGEWWLTDGGHLLGRLQESKRPVALLRTGSGYELHDPVEHSVTPVDDAVAGSLVPFAQSFFRSLPSRPLKFRDLASFALGNVGNDARWLIGLGVLIGLLGMLTPIVTGYIFDALIPASDRPQIAQITGVLIAVAIAAAMFSVARSTAMLRLESRMDAGLQAALWDRALNLPIPFFKRYSSGDLAQRLNAINAIRQVLSGTTIGTLLASVFSLVNIALLFYYDLKLGAVALGLVLGAAALTIGMGLIKLRYDRHMAESWGKLSGLVLEYLRGVTKLRVTGAESRAFANWATEFSRMRRLSFGSGNVQNVNDVFFTLYQVVVDMVIFGTAAWLLTQSLTASVTQAALALPGKPAPLPMTTGQFIAFYGAFGQVMGAVIGLSTTVLTVLNLVPLYERIKPILQAEPEADITKSHPGELQGQVDLVNVTFRYREDGPAVLDNVSFSIRPGGFVAVVGPSGSGKSTLLRCLLGFEHPSAGGVFYDNQNMADLDTRAVRRQMGVVLQHSQVMPGDIFSNIVGTTQLNIEDAWAAARFCGLEDDIRAMPMGMHTVISEGGNTLSGGQRQRILIARAIVQRPRILLFDEATSALDNPTQEIVTRSLNELRATRVVIAHRLSTIMNADHILVMDGGRVVQSGSYAQLMAQPGLFRELATRQLV